MSWIVLFLMRFGCDVETGDGTQLCYIYPPHIGDTLSVMGCGGFMCDETRFIVK